MPTIVVRNKKSATEAVSGLRSQERFWLMGASLVLALGLLLTYRAKTDGFADAHTQLEAGTLVNVNTLESAGPLLPLFMREYPDPADRQFVAEEIANYLRQRGNVPNVGALNTIRVHPDSAAQHGGTEFKARAAATEGNSLPLLTSGTFSRLKPHLVARTPSGFNKQFWLLTLIFFGLFWGIHLVWTQRDFRGDALLLPVVFLLLGLSFIFMLSLPDPLRDYLRMQRVVLGGGVGCVLLLVVSLLDVQKLGRAWSYSTKSFIWLALAALLSVALITLGSGPEGSSAKVNLWIFQPVELIKACLLLFFAGYFARNWRFLRELKQDTGSRTLRRLDLAVPRLKYAWPIIFGVAMALGFFVLQKDLGPALVICTTFLILYGLVRRRWIAVSLGFAGLVAGFWLCYRYEIVTTVVNRISMMLSPWDNVARGGEHIAHAFWALTSGGIFGQGLGDGSPLSIPAAHTDMILAVIGEELGFIGLLAVLALYVLLIQRGLVVSLRAKAPFSFFLGMGIVLATALQLLLITGGMLGVIPLSGVVSPLLSYGMTSTVMTLLFMGVLFSISAHPGTREQRDAQQQRFGRPVTALSLVLVALLGVLALRAAYIQIWHGDEWLLKPALVIRADGSHSFVYNPRILYARNLIPRGTIYDRNGIPLATSNDADIEDHTPALQELGVDTESLLTSRNERLYPFGGATFYLLGDINVRALWPSNGLYAEDSLLSRLRGYNNHPQTLKIDTLRVTRYDYTELLPLVHDGTRSRASQRLLEQNRDVYLTIDVRLQKRIADVIHDRVQSDPNLRGRFISAAVLDVATGDVLASVTYPLPDSVENYLDPNYFDRAAYATRAPGSTFKLATAMAGYHTMGDNVDTWSTSAVPGVLLPLAIEKSDNGYFSALAYEAGPDAVLDVIETFGFTVWRDGLTRAQKLTRLRRDLNDKAQTGFGQGELVGSPLLVARLAATVANDGKMPPINWLRDEGAPPSAAVPVITPAQARRLGAYMRQVVVGPSGTARRTLGNSGLPIAGKTGTAEQLGLGRRRVNHAWFTGFAPYRDVPNGAPQIAVAVLIEAKPTDQGRQKLGGGSDAAPIAGSIFDEAVGLGIIRRPVSSRR